MKLFTLEPIGVGTSEVESLSSYVHRLSLIHGVTVGQLLERVERLSGRQRAPYRNSPVLAAFVRPNDTTQTLVEDLEKVTNQKDLAALTLLPIRPCLARDMGCYAKDMRWCPECLLEQRASGSESYYKLIWQFADVKFCHFHGRTIERVCPRCGKHQNTLKVRSGAEYCQKCRRKLEACAEGDHAPSYSWHNDAFDLCSFVAELREYANNPPDEQAPVRFIDSVFDYYWFSGKERELYAKVDHHEMLGILHGDSPVTLRTVRKYAFQLALPIGRFLGGADTPYEPALALKNTYKPNQLNRRSRKKLEHNSVLKRIDAILNEKRPGLSLRQLAEHVDVSVGYIAHRLPHIHRKVVEERRFFLAQEKERKRREALVAAFQYFTRDERLFAKSRKQALRVLMEETGLPKNVLRDAIAIAYEKASIAI